MPGFNAYIETPQDVLVKHGLRRRVFAEELHCHLVATKIPAYNLH